jgi:hypothetical protein
METNETQQKVKLGKIVLAYMKSNWMWVALFGYEIVAVILASLNVVDVGIPCLYSTFMGVKCPGCGLTHAAIELLKLNFSAAYEENPLIYIVLPVILALVIFDFRKFTKHFHVMER